MLLEILFKYYSLSIKYNEKVINDAFCLTRRVKGVVNSIFNERFIKAAPTKLFFLTYIRGKVFKRGPSKICGRQPLKRFYFVHS